MQLLYPLRLDATTKEEIRDYFLYDKDKSSGDDRNTQTDIGFFHHV